MRASIFVGTSLDGFIARAQRRLRLPVGRQRRGRTSRIRRLPIHGRRARHGAQHLRSRPAVPDLALRPEAVFVLSSRPLPAAPNGAIVERISGTPSEVLSLLSARGFRHVYVDGGATIQAFLRQVSFSASPSPASRPHRRRNSLFAAVDADIPLRHIATRQFASGLVQSEYAVELGRTDAGTRPTSGTAI